EVHGPSTAVESGGGNSPFRLHCEELACGQVGGRFLSILAARRSPEKGRFPPHEAHLPAQRSPPQAQARLSDAHVLPRGPADPQATPRQGPRAPLRVAAPKLSCSGEAREPPVPEPGLRGRLPARPVGVVALPRSLLVSAGGGRSAAVRLLGAPLRRRRCRAEQDQAAVAGGLARAARACAG